MQSRDNGEVISTKPLLPTKLKSYVAVEMEIMARELEKIFQVGFRKNSRKDTVLVRITNFMKHQFEIAYVT